MIESKPPVLDLLVTGSPGDTFLFASSVGPGITAYMDVRGVGVGALCSTVNSDPNDSESPAYTGPDSNGNYTIYLSTPNDSVVTTASFTAYSLLDITFRA
jgi:hypothetical protein